MQNRKIQVFHLSDGHDLSNLMKLIDLDEAESFLEELKRMKIQSLVLNHISNGLMVCDANRALDTGRGYLSSEEFKDRKIGELWYLTIVRAYGALLLEESYNPIDPKHKYGMLKFYSNYINVERY